MCDECFPDGFLLDDLLDEEDDFVDFVAAPSESLCAIATGTSRHATASAQTAPKAFRIGRQLPIICFELSTPIPTTQKFIL